VSWTAGTELKPLVKAAITREQLAEYAAASGDHNPIHLDEKFAKEAGFPSVIVHGMLSMAFLGDVVGLNFPEPAWTLTKLRTRFRKVTFPGDVITCRGKVKQVGEGGLLVVTLATVNQKGETTTEGEAELRPRPA
jgi:acyl dehydratase